MTRRAAWAGYILEELRAVVELALRREAKALRGWRGRRPGLEICCIYLSQKHIGTENATSDAV